MESVQEAQARKQPIERWLVEPMSQFINNSTSSGIVLFASALAAIILSNSPLADDFHRLWAHKFSIGYDEYVISKDLLHWINDGLMAVFFFVIGLELKREILAGELSEPRKAIIPVAAGIGGMLFPALIYLIFNPSNPERAGWGVPMATDIAFALGVLYLLGNRVPITLKVFITSLAIADDIGAVLVIALFYTSNISVESLLTGAGFFTVLVLANYLGVRSTIFYSIVGIGGLWLAFLMSGIHATIAAVIAAFTIPANVKITETVFVDKLQRLIANLKAAKTNRVPLVTKEQLHVIEKMRQATRHALTPLQRLEYALHPVVAFFILPVFAFANAGVSISFQTLWHFTSPVALGVALGLLVGKVIGVTGMVWLMTRLRIAILPRGMTWRHVIGAGFLAAIGFTMSLFISSLAFTDIVFINEAKIGILAASITGGTIGYLILRSSPRLSGTDLESGNF